MRKLPTNKEYKNAKVNGDYHKRFVLGEINEWYGLQVSKTLIKKRDKLIKDIIKLNKEAETKLKNKLNWRSRYDLIYDFSSIELSETPEEIIKYLKYLLDISKKNLKNDLSYLKSKASIKK